MKFIIAPDKFKGSLTGFEFCDAVTEGLQMIFKQAEIVKMPLADGGDGTIEVVKHYLKGEKISITVNDPLFRPIEASYVYAAESQIAFIEMAEASGLKLLAEDEKRVMDTSSFGTGELIVDALDQGAQKIILGIGGSATNDGGMGIASALGYLFLDANSKPLKPIGRHLNGIRSIDDFKKHPRLQAVKFKIACDVSNPFYGDKGAAYIYAEQKGASKDDINFLDQGLRNFRNVLLDQYNIDVQSIDGSGAAGGIGGGAVVFLNGELTSGIDLIKQLANFDQTIDGADWIITGEGKLDAQTLSGKTIDGVVKSAAAKKIPVAALCGSVDLSLEEQQQMGLTYATPILKEITNLQTALEKSYDNLVYAAYNFANLLKTKSDEP